MKIMTSMDRLRFVKDAVQQGNLSYRNPQQAFKVASCLAPDGYGGSRSFDALRTWI